MLFLDGLMIPTSKAFVEALSPGILLGQGVFETMRSYSGRIFALEEHFTRLFAGLESLKIKPPFSKQKIEDYLYLSLHTNRLKNARLRLTIWQTNSRVRISIVASPYRPPSPAIYKQGFTAEISDIVLRPRPRRPAIKSINYHSFMLAYRRARDKGHDEAILLNGEGYVAEGSRSNIFFVKDDTLYTPRLTCGCLNGITRHIVLTIAREIKIECQEVTIVPEELFRADEAFLTNSLIELMPLRCLQGQLIGKGTMGELTAKLLKSYRRLTQNTFI